jgi:hypothetical protein
MIDPLFDVGTIVTAETEIEGEFAIYLIIGKRAYNPNSGKSWDYISVPLPEGFVMNNKANVPYENTNLLIILK